MGLAVRVIVKDDPHGLFHSAYVNTETRRILINLYERWPTLVTLDDRQGDIRIRFADGRSLALRVSAPVLFGAFDVEKDQIVVPYR